MTQVALSNAPARQTPNLVVWLTRIATKEGVKDWTVERITVKSNSFNHDVNFTNKKCASQKFSPKFWSFIRGYLPESTDTFVLTARDTMFESSNILLQGLEVTGQTAKNGIQRIFLSFKNMLGTLKGVFAPNAMPDLLQEVQCDLSTRTLNDILLPAINIAATEPINSFESAGKNVEAFVGRLKENKYDIEFYAALLTRYSASADRDNWDSKTMISTDKLHQNHTSPRGRITHGNYSPESHSDRR